MAGREALSTQAEKDAYDAGYREFKSLIDAGEMLPPSTFRTPRSLTLGGAAGAAVRAIDVLLDATEAGHAAAVREWKETRKKAAKMKMMMAEHYDAKFKMWLQQCAPPVMDGHANPSCCVTCKRPATQRCSRCKSALYCDPMCQRADWKTHKKMCHAPNTAT